MQVRVSEEMFSILAPRFFGRILPPILLVRYSSHGYASVGQHLGKAQRTYDEFGVSFLRLA